MYDDDVLQPISVDDVPKLRDIYKEQLPHATYIYNYLNSVIKWKAERPDTNWITMLAPQGDWKDGTFIGIHEFSCYELFMYTLEKDGKRLRQALIDTKRIKWNASVLFYSLYSELYPIVQSALEQTTFRSHHTTVCDIWWMPKEKAINLEINCPPEVYVEKLNPSHAAIINSHWPHRYLDSDKYISTIIEMNGGCGVFLKSNDMLVAWVLRNLLGLGALQTADDFKRKGYGSLVTRALAKELAKTGADPLGTVLQQNNVSQAMFKTIGFEKAEAVVYIENYESGTD